MEFDALLSSRKEDEAQQRIEAIGARASSAEHSLLSPEFVKLPSENINGVPITYGKVNKVKAQAGVNTFNSVTLIGIYYYIDLYFDIPFDNELIAFFPFCIPGHSVTAFNIPAVIRTADRFHVQLGFTNGNVPIKFCWLAYGR